MADAGGPLVPWGDTTIAAGQSFRSTGGIEDVRLALGSRASSWLDFGVGLHALTGRNQIQVTETSPTRRSSRRSLTPIPRLTASAASRGQRGGHTAVATAGHWHRCARLDRSAPTPRYLAEFGQRAPACGSGHSIYGHLGLSLAVRVTGKARQNSTDWESGQRQQRVGMERGSGVHGAESGEPIDVAAARCTDPHVAVRS